MMAPIVEVYDPDHNDIDSGSSLGFNKSLEAFEDLEIDDEAGVRAPRTQHTRVIEPVRVTSEEWLEEDPEHSKQILIVDDQSYNIKALEIIFKTRFKLDVEKLVVRAYHGK